MITLPTLDYQRTCYPRQLSPALFSVAYIVNNMDSDQTAPLGAVRLGFIWFASVWSVFEYMQHICKAKTTFSEQKKIGRFRVNQYIRFT